jgi:hypothetical protein
VTREPELGRLRSRALHLANKDGYDAPMIARTLLREDELVEVLRRSGPEVAKHHALEMATWAVEHVASNPKDTYKARVVENIVRWRAEADRVSWCGRTGPTDRKVLESFYLAGSNAASTKFRHAARTIGNRTGLPWTTASAATRRLIDRRMIRYVGGHYNGPNGPSLGAKYQLAAPSAWNVPNLHDRSYPPPLLCRYGPGSGCELLTIHSFN